MTDSRQSLIFIPDISGFTEFVNSTEIEHSQHIISELLEIIIDANQLMLSLSEVEGDAVLFYAHNRIPTKQEIWQQSKAIFINFHAHLKRYDKERICQCGACSSASGLSIKFIAHAGDIGFTTIKGRKKPFGADLIIGHKLLKNDINDHEYILISDSLSQAWDHSGINDDFSLESIAGESSYAKLGIIKYTYAPLGKLYREVPEPQPEKKSPLTKNPAVLELEIEQEIEVVFDILIDLELRVKWNKALNKIEFDRNKVNRVGTKHKCLFDGGFADFKTVTNDFGHDKIVYGEKIESLKAVKEVNVYYILKKVAKGSSTSIRVEIHVSPLPIIGWLINPLIKKKMLSSLRTSLLDFKMLAESTKST